MDWYERNEKINSLLNDEFEGKLKSLKATCEKIKNKYKNIFSAKRILGVDDFPNIINRCENKKEEQCNTLTEKCICRAHQIEKLLRKYENDSKEKELIEDLNMFWNIISYDLLPLEILWGMEYEKEDDRTFSKAEDEVYEYLKNWANYYLKTTKEYYSLLSFVPCEKAFIVAPEKSKEFNNLKPNYELREENKKFLGRFLNLKIELDNQDKVLKKTKKPNVK